MRIEIKNYKSIKKAELNINNKINYIIGKNESGKSSILDAINELNDQKISESKTNFNNDGDVHIDFEYEIMGDLKESWKKVLNLEDVFISKTINKDGTKYHDEQMFNEVIVNRLKTIYDLDNENNIVELILSNELKLIDGGNDDENIKDEIKGILIKSLNHKEMYNIIKYSQNDFPYLKRKYTFEEAKNDNTFMALWRLLDHSIQDIDDLINFSDDKKIDKKKSLEKNLTKKIESFIEDFWSQKTISFEIIINDNNFVVRAADKFDDEKTGQYRDIEIRSSGMISYLTLILFISSLDSSKQNIVLLDEPGSKLHSNAISDLRKFLETRKENIKFVLATHNSAFVSWENIDNFNLVIKNDEEKGTELISKFANKSINENKSGFAPFLYWLGVDKKAFFSISEDINVFVEGIHDCILMKAMYNLYTQDKDEHKLINFIPMGSATKESSLISLSIATNKRIPYFIFDNDEQGQKGKKKINKIFFKNISNDMSFFISGKNDFDSKIGNVETQNLFGDEEFNDKKIADNKSFKFYHELSIAIEKNEHKPLDSTIENFKKIFDRIK